MKIGFSFNTQEGIIILILFAMVVFRTIIGSKMRRRGRVENVKDAVKMFLISDLGIITLIIIYIFEATLKLSLLTTVCIIIIFMSIFVFLYKKI